MKFMLRFQDWRRNPKGKVAQLLPELSEFRTNLCISTDCPPLDGIVAFFDAMSKWHDRSDEIGQLIVGLQEVNHGQHTELINMLTNLRAHFVNGGRDRYGWNRTQRGETVTAEKVFLGNIFGLFTHPVSKWKQGKNEPKGGWDGGMWHGHSAVTNKNAYDVVSNQAADFMQSHTGPICSIVEWLENNLAQAKAA